MSYYIYYGFLLLTRKTHRKRYMKWDHRQLIKNANCPLTGKRSTCALINLRFIYTYRGMFPNVQLFFHPTTFHYLPCSCTWKTKITCKYKDSSSAVSSQRFVNQWEKDKNQKNSCVIQRRLMSLTVMEHTSKCIIKIKARIKTKEIQNYISFAAQPGGANIP